MTDTQRWKWTVAQIALAVVTVPLFAVVLVWTWERPDTARGLILISIVLIVGAASHVMEARARRHLDEKEIAARGFAAHWSSVAVGLLAAFSILLAPMRSVLGEIYASLPQHAHADGPQRMFVLGIVAALLVRKAATLLRAAWMQARR